MDHQNQESPLEQRVHQLEKQSRRLKLLLLGIPFVALMLGAEAAEKTTPTKTLAAEKLVLVSPGGKGRATLSMVDGSPQLDLTDKEGRTRVRLAADNKNEGPALLLLNEQGDSIAMLRNANKTGSLILCTGKYPVVTVSEADVSNGYGTINFYDGKGNWKQALGGGSLK